jgi:hypothetical protein
LVALYGIELARRRGGWNKHTHSPSYLDECQHAYSHEFESVVKGDEKIVVADKAYWSQTRSEWCGERGIANGISHKLSLGEKLRPTALRANLFFSSSRYEIETVFG